MNQGNSSAANARRAKFAIECRKIRLLIASTPGIGNFDIQRQTGIKPGYHLMKMRAMGIIEVKGHESNGGWFVIPQ